MSIKVGSRVGTCQRSKVRIQELNHPGCPSLTMTMSKENHSFYGNISIEQGIAKSGWIDQGVPRFESFWISRIDNDMFKEGPLHVMYG